MNVIITDFTPSVKKKNLLPYFTISMHHATCKNTLGFLFSGSVGMENAQGEISSLVLVREVEGVGVETDDLWSDIELSDFPTLEGKVPLPQFGCSAEGLSWSA